MNIINQFKKNFRLYLTFFFIIILILIAEFSGLREELSLTYIKSIFKENLLLSSMGFILLFCIGNLAQIPGWPFLAASIFALGEVRGYFLTYLAAIISAIFSYFIIRSIGKDSLRSLENKFVKKTLEKLDERPLKISITLRFLFQTAPALNYSLSLSGVKFKDYLLGAILGLPIPILIFTLFIDKLITFLTP